MAEFDPDKYLSDFNPDAFLAEKASGEGVPWEDLGKSGGIGLAKGLIAGAGTLGNLREGAKMVADKLGMSPESRDFVASSLLGPAKHIVAAAPTGADIQKNVEGYTGEFYKPKTKPGEYAESAAEFAGNPLSYIGPGGPALKAGIAAAGGLGSQAGRDIAGEDSAYKDLMGLVGSLVGSFGAAGAAGILRNIANVFPGRPTLRAPGEFDFATTRGVLERDPAQIAREEAMATGSFGPSAQRIMERNRLQREADIEAAQERIRAGLGGAEATPAEAGNLITQSLRERTESLRSAGDKLYEGAWAQQAVGHNIRPTQPVMSALAREGLPDPARLGGYPGAERALNMIRELEGMHPPAPAPFTIAMNDVHEVAKQIRGIKASSAGDGQVIGVIRKAFDDYEAGLVNNAMFQNDKLAGLDRQLARDVWRRYHQSKGSDKGGGYAKILSDIAEKNITGEQVGNLLTNAVNVNQAAAAGQLVRYLRGAFGRNSQEIEVLRQAMWGKVSGLGEVQANNIPAILANRGRIARDIERFVSGNGAPLARQLYTEAERARMLRFVDALRRTNPERVNPSGSGSWITRYMWPLSTGALSVGLGGAYGAHEGEFGWRQMGAALAVPFIRNAAGARRALRATTNVRRGSPTLETLRGALPGTVGAAGEE